MSRLRFIQQGNFIHMSATAFRDPSLSNKSRGLLGTLITLPENWEFSIRGLAKICHKDGYDTLTSQIHELEENGYFICCRARDEKGRLKGTVFYVSEEPWWNIPREKLPPDLVLPKQGKPKQENPKQENPKQDNPAQVKQAQSNIQESNKQQLRKQLFSNLSINLDMNDRQAVEEAIKENLEFDIISDMESAERLQEIIDIIVDTVCSTKDTIRINNEDMPYEVVTERLLSLNSEHILYAIDCMDNRSGVIRNIRAYVLTLLYNAPSTMENYYKTLYERNQRNDQE